MSTSLRRSVGSTATRKVIGWSLPSTLPTAAKPSSESARETRSTLAVSTRSVSTRAPGPNSRAIDAVTLAGGAAGFCAVTRSAASASVMSELVTDAEAQHLGLAHAGCVAEQLVVPLERGVPGRLVGDAERRDAASQRPVPRHAGRDARLGVVALVAEEGVELLGGRRIEESQQVVRPLDVATGDTPAHGPPVRRVDRLGIAHTDVRDHGPQRQRPALVARVRGEERHRSPETSRPHRRRKAIGTQPVPEVHPIREPAATGNRAHRTEADLAPGGGNHVVIESGALHAVEGRRLVRLIDHPDRRQHEPRAQSDPVPQAVIEADPLDRDLPARLSALDLRVLDFELGAERQSLIEAVREVDDEAGKVDDGGSLGAGGVGVVHLAIAPDGGAFLGGEDLEGTGRHDSKEAPPDDRPHYDSVVMLVENGYQPEIPEFKIRDSDGQAAIILVRTMSLILVALVLLLAGGLGWGALHLKRRLERSERDRRRAADELNRRLSELFSLQELSYILAGSLQLDRIVDQVVRYAMRVLGAHGALVARAAARG